MTAIPTVKNHQSDEERMFSEREVRKALYERMTKYQLFWIALSFASVANGEEFSIGGGVSMENLLEENSYLGQADKPDKLVTAVKRLGAQERLSLL